MVASTGRTIARGSHRLRIMGWSSESVNIAMVALCARTCVCECECVRVRVRMCVSVCVSVCVMGVRGRVYGYVCLGIAQCERKKEDYFLYLTSLGSNLCALTICFAIAIDGQYISKHDQISHVYQEVNENVCILVYLSNMRCDV